jgi:hypothetical protein
MKRAGPNYIPARQAAPVTPETWQKPGLLNTGSIHMGAHPGVPHYTPLHNQFSSAMASPVIPLGILTRHDIVFQSASGDVGGVRFNDDKNSTGANV